VAQFLGRHIPGNPAKFTWIGRAADAVADGVA